MKKVIIFILFPLLLQSQNIRKLEKSLENRDYHKCIKKSNRYLKWHKRDREVYFYLSSSYLGLLNDQKSLRNRLLSLNKSLRYLTKFNQYNDKTVRSQRLESILDSISVLISDNLTSNTQLKRLNKSYKNLFGIDLDNYYQFINEQERIVDSITLLSFNVQTPDQSAIFGEYIPKRINGDQLIETSLGLLGVEYKWAGETPAGFDCSGYVMYVFKQMGVILPHNAHKISCLGKEVELSEIKTGDLICFGTPERINHIGIYYNIDGEDGVIHCIYSGVRFDQGDQWKYWKPKIAKVRRIVLL